MKYIIDWVFKTLKQNDMLLQYAMQNISQVRAGMHCETWCRNRVQKWEMDPLYNVYAFKSQVSANQMLHAQMLPAWKCFSRPFSNHQL